MCFSNEHRVAGCLNKYIKELLNIPTKKKFKKDIL